MYDAILIRAFHQKMNTFFPGTRVPGLAPLGFILAAFPIPAISNNLFCTSVGAIFFFLSSGEFSNFDNSFCSFLSFSSLKMTKFLLSHTNIF